MLYDLVQKALFAALARSLAAFFLEERNCGERPTFALENNKKK